MGFGLILTKIFENDINRYWQIPSELEESEMHKQNGPPFFLIVFVCVFVFARPGMIHKVVVPAGRATAVWVATTYDEVAAKVRLAELRRQAEPEWYSRQVDSIRMFDQAIQRDCEVADKVAAVAHPRIGPNHWQQYLVRQKHDEIVRLRNNLVISYQHAVMRYSQGSHCRGVERDLPRVVEPFEVCRTV